MTSRQRERWIEAANTAFCYESRSSIERGENVDWEHDLADAYLFQPDSRPHVTQGMFDPEDRLWRSLTSLPRRRQTKLYSRIHR